MEEICDAVAFFAIIVFVLGIHGAIGFRGKNAWAGGRARHWKTRVERGNA